MLGIPAQIPRVLSLLVLGPLALGPAVLPPQPRRESAPPRRGFYAVPFSSGAWPTVLHTLEEEARNGAELVELGDLDAELEVYDRRLAIVAAAERARASQVWWVRFEVVTGVVQLEALDLVTGLRTARGDKLRAIGGAELGPEPLARLRALGAAVREGAREARENLEAGVPNDGSADAEDEEPHPGFGWEYRGDDTVVTWVVAESVAGRAGLAVGDRILSVAGVETPSPLHFGRAISSIPVGEEVALSVDRRGESLELELRPEPTASLLARNADALLGRSLESLVPPAAAALLREGAGPGAHPLVLAVLRLDQPRGRLPLLRLAAERARSGEERCGFVVVHVDELPPVLARWAAGHGLARWVRDEGLAKALRVFREPAVLVFDAEGVLRERPRTPTEEVLAFRRQVGP